MSGWIALTRDSFSHPLFKREPVTEWEAFARLIRRAAWEDTRHRVGGELMDVPRGSFFCTLRDLQLEFMWKSDARVRNFLKRLENERMIERKTNAGKTHVTICNYDEYQASERRGERKTNAPKTQDERTKVTSKQINKKQEGKKERSPTGSRLSPDWVPSQDFIEFAEGQGWPFSAIQTEADKFRDYWIAQAGAKGRKADWLATWRNWIRRATTPTNGAPHERPRTAQERAAADDTAKVDAWLDAGRQHDEEQGYRDGEGDHSFTSERGMDCGADGDPVVALFPARSGREGFGGGGPGLDFHSRQISTMRGR